MANQKQVHILNQGVEGWNEWKEKNYDAEIDLSDAILGYANLSGAILSYANLSRAIPIDTNLRRTILKESNLAYAKLWTLKVSPLLNSMLHKIKKTQPTAMISKPN